MEVGQVLDVEISSLAFSGSGVALITEDGKPCSIFVPMSVPGDVLKVKITSAKHRFAEAEIVEEKKRASSHIKAPCPYFGLCGGCDWQHVSYDVQLKEKSRLAKEAVEKVQKGGFEMLPIIPSEPFGYRNRARFHSEQKDGQYVLGLKQRESNAIVDIDQCLVASESINRRLALCRARKETESLDLADSSIVPLPEYGINLHFYPNCFTQQNWAQNQVLVKSVMDLVDLKEDEVLLDLYCGIGNFSLPAAKYAKAVVGIDGAKLSVKAAIENARSHRLNNVSFKDGDVLGFLKNGKLRFDVCIADPSRDGLGTTARFLNGSNIKRIVLVSCGLRALSQDLKALSNYRVEKVLPIDMAPQTVQVETVVLLKKLGQNTKKNQELKVSKRE